MDFIGDFWKFCSEYEIHRNYAFWSALGLLGATINRKVYFLHGAIEIHPNLYVLLVGPQGNGKSTCKDFARDLFIEVCPHLSIGASTQSAEDIVQVMAKDDFPTDYFTNEQGENVVTRPLAFFVNEFKNWIAYSPTRMLNFLGDIYDRKVFDSSTIKRGVEKIVNPSLNILACENPDQFIKFMKNDIVTGGISRRFVIVNELGYADPKAVIVPRRYDDNPTWRQMKERLIACRKENGVFKMTSSGQVFYVPWYEKKQKSLGQITNSIMRGYISTKHIQLFKVCMLLDCVSDKPARLLTGDLLEFGLSFLDVIEKNMPLLSQASGRNPMAPSYIRIVELTEGGWERDGVVDPGWLPEKVLRKQLESELQGFEFDSAIRHLAETDQIIKKRFNVPNKEGKNVEREMILIPAKYKQMIDQGIIKRSEST